MGCQAHWSNDSFLHSYFKAAMQSSTGERYKNLLDISARVYLYVLGRNMILRVNKMILKHI